jgi:hypothetical protein
MSLKFVSIIKVWKNEQLCPKSTINQALNILLHIGKMHKV